MSAGVQPSPVPLADAPAHRPVLSSTAQFTGGVWDIDTDEVDLGEAGIVTRDVVRHPGAVAIMALNDDGEVYLVRQYRHPVRAEAWEPPAGLMDEAGEEPLAAAQRELLEEADLRADTWHVLLDAYTSPGGSSEMIRIYLARDLHEVPVSERHLRTEEESQMAGAWVPLIEVVDAVLTGRVHSPTIVMGTLALDAALGAGGASLLPADAPWERPPIRRR